MEWIGCRKPLCKQGRDVNIARLSRTTASTVHHNCPKLSSSFRPATVQFPSRYWLSTSPKKPIIHAYFRRSPPLSIHQRSWKCSIVVAIYRFIVAQRNAPVRSPAGRPSGRNIRRESNVIKSGPKHHRYSGSAGTVATVENQVEGKMRCYARFVHLSCCK